MLRPDVHCSENNIGSAGLRLVGEALQQVTSLTSLDVGYACPPLAFSIPQIKVFCQVFVILLESLCASDTTTPVTSRQLQDLGDDVWLFVAALLPRIASITVSHHSAPLPSSTAALHTFFMSPFSPQRFQSKNRFQALMILACSPYADSATGAGIFWDGGEVRALPPSTSAAWRPPRCRLGQSQRGQWSLHLVRQQFEAVRSDLG